MNTGGTDLVLVGRVVKPHGLTGEVLVRVLTENPDRFQPGAELFLGPDDGPATRAVVAGSRSHKGGLLVRFEGTADRDGAESIRNQGLFVDRELLGELAEDEYWEHQLLGLEVVHVDGTVLGKLTAVLERPAQDLWTVQTDRGNVLFPAAKELVVEVDLGLGRAVVDPPEGLF